MRARYFIVFSFVLAIGMILVICAGTSDVHAAESVRSTGSQGGNSASNDLQLIIDKAIARLPKPSSYLYDTKSVSGQIASTWTEMTARLLGTRDLRVAYDNFYQSAVEYAALVEINLLRAKRAVSANDLTAATGHYEAALRYEKQFYLNDKAAIESFNGNITAAAELAKGIYDGSKAAAIYGSSMVMGPTSSRVVDTVFDVTDFAIEASDSGLSSASRQFVAGKLTEMIFSEAKVTSLNGKTVSDAIDQTTTKVLGSPEIYKLVSEIASKPDFAKAFMSFMAKSGSYAGGAIAEDQLNKIVTAMVDSIASGAPTFTVCGSKWYQRLGVQMLEVEQAIIGGYSFDTVCHAHDVCYGDCKTAKADCDKSLLSDANNACTTARNKAHCMFYAQLFYDKVTQKGDTPFKEARTACPSTLESNSPAVTSPAVASALVLDRSSSMLEAARAGGTKMDRAKEAARAYIKGLTSSDAASISTFSEVGATELPMQEVAAAVSALDRVLNGIQPVGRTNIGAGLEQAYVQLGKNLATQGRVALLLSDGVNNVGSWNMIVNEFHAKHWPIYTVGFGANADTKALQDIAMKTGGRFSPTEDQDIVSTYQQISNYVQKKLTLVRATDILPPGASLEYPFTANPKTDQLAVQTSWQGSRLRTTLVSPKGLTIVDEQSKHRGGRYEIGKTYATMELPNPEPGDWTIRVDWAVPPPIAEQVFISVSEKSKVTAGILAFKPQYQPQEAVAVTVDVAEVSGASRIPLVGAKVEVQIQKPGQKLTEFVHARSSNWVVYKEIVNDLTRKLTLLDDGGHSDYLASDGVYGGLFQETEKPGSYLVTATIKGKGKNGQEIRSTLHATFQVGPIENNQITNSEAFRYSRLAEGDAMRAVKEKLGTGATRYQSSDTLDRLKGDAAQEIERLMK